MSPSQMSRGTTNSPLQHTFPPPDDLSVRYECALLCSTHLFGNSSSRRQVRFVTSKRNDDIGICLPLQLTDPRFGFLQGRLLRNVVHDDSTVCIAIVHGCQGLVPLLPGSIPKCIVSGQRKEHQKYVPNLEFHCRILVKAHCLCEECGFGAISPSSITRRSTHRRWCSPYSHRIDPSQSAEQD